MDQSADRDVTLVFIARHLEPRDHVLRGHGRAHDIFDNGALGKITSYDPADDPLYLARVNRLTGMVVQTVKLGIPQRVYSFAYASEIRFIGDSAYIAWVLDEKLWHTALPEKEYYKLQTEEKLLGRNWRGVGYFYRYTDRFILSRWNLKTHQVEHFLLPLPVGSSRPSINVIGDKLLMAWHIGYPNAKIMTHLMNVSDLPNQPPLIPALYIQPDKK